MTEIRSQIHSERDKAIAESGDWTGDSPIQPEFSGEAVISGALSKPGLERELNLKLRVYDEAYYDAKDVVGDLTVGGVDIGDWKMDAKVGGVQSGVGVGYNKTTGKYSAGAFFETSSVQLTGEGVVGSENLGVTADAQIEGPKAEGFLGYRDGSVGGSLGFSLASAEAGGGVNLAGANVGVRGGISFGLEFGVQIGKETEVKLGPFKLGLSLGSQDRALVPLKLNPCTKCRKI